MQVRRITTLPFARVFFRVDTWGSQLPSWPQTHSGLIVCRRAAVFGASARPMKAILQRQPSEDDRKEPWPAVKKWHRGWRPEIERRLTPPIAEYLPSSLLACPACPHHTGTAIAGGITHALAREDTRDHVAVHGDMAKPTVRDLDAVEHWKDVGERASQIVGRPG